MRAKRAFGVLGTYFLGKDSLGKLGGRQVYTTRRSKNISKDLIQKYSIKLLGGDFLEYQFVNTPGSARYARPGYQELIEKISYKNIL